MKQEVAIGCGPNGGIFKWKDPLTGKTVFEWNEDFKYGSHYHIVVYSPKESHVGHFKAGELIPEPWNRIFF